MSTTRKAVTLALVLVPMIWVVHHVTRTDVGEDERFHRIKYDDEDEEENDMEFASAYQHDDDRGPEGGATWKGWNDEQDTNSNVGNVEADWTQEIREVEHDSGAKKAAGAASAAEPKDIEELDDLEQQDDDQDDWEEELNKPVLEEAKELVVQEEEHFMLPTGKSFDGGVQKHEEHFLLPTGKFFDSDTKDKDNDDETFFDEVKQPDTNIDMNEFDEPEETVLLDDHEPEIDHEALIEEIMENGDDEIFVDDTEVEAEEKDIQQMLEREEEEFAERKDDIDAVEEFLEEEEDQDQVVDFDEDIDLQEEVDEEEILMLKEHATGGSKKNKKLDDLDKDDLTELKDTRKFSQIDESDLQKLENLLTGEELASENDDFITEADVTHEINKAKTTEVEKLLKQGDEEMNRVSDADETNLSEDEDWEEVEQEIEEIRDREGEKSRNDMFDELDKTKKETAKKKSSNDFSAYDDLEMEQLEDIDDEDDDDDEELIFEDDEEDEYLELDDDDDDDDDDDGDLDENIDLDETNDFLVDGIVPTLEEHFNQLTEDQILEMEALANAALEGSTKSELVPSKKKKKPKFFSAVITDDNVHIDDDEDEDDEKFIEEEVDFNDQLSNNEELLNKPLKKDVKEMEEAIEKDIKQPVSKTKKKKKSASGKTSLISLDEHTVQTVKQLEAIWSTNDECDRTGKHVTPKNIPTEWSNKKIWLQEIAESGLLPIEESYRSLSMVLIAASKVTSGPILEFGYGLYSTPVLAHIGREQHRYVMSTGVDEQRLQRFQDQFTWRCHDFIVLDEEDPDSWDEIGGPGRWSMVIVHDNPQERRTEDLQRMADKADILISPDYEDADEFFTYEYKWSLVRPRITIMSNSRPDVVDRTKKLLNWLEEAFCSEKNNGECVM